MKSYKGNITELKDDQIFVFGSNTEGRHGKGAALFAREKFGAVYGQAEGLQGKSYAIITKDLTKKSHPSITRSQIKDQIEKLYKFAIDNPGKEFLVPYNHESSNLNFYTSYAMADMFASFPVPENIAFEENFSRTIKAFRASILWP